MARLRTHELHRGEALSIHVVESIDVQRANLGSGCCLFARLEPIALVFRKADEVKAFDMAARELDFLHLQALVPELAEFQW